MDTTQIKFAGSGPAFMDSPQGESIPPLGGVQPLEDVIETPEGDEAGEVITAADLPPVEEIALGGDSGEVIEAEAAEHAEEDEIIDGDDEEGGEFNPHFFLAQQLKNDGLLPEEFKVEEEVSYNDIVTKYKERMAEPIRQEIESSAAQDLLAKGWTEEDLFYARAWKQGVDPRVFQPAERMRQFGSADISTMDKEAKLAAVRSMYEFRGTSETEAEVLIQYNDDAGTFDDLVTESIGYHKNGYDGWYQQEQQRAQQFEEAQRNQRADVQNKITRIIAEKKVGGLVMTPDQAKDLHKDIYEANASVELEGKVQRIPEINKFLFDLQSDVELQVKLFMLHKYQDRILQSAKNTAVSELEESLLKASGRVIKPKNKTSQTRRPKDATVGDPKVLARLQF